MTNSLKISIRMAVILGIFLPVLETIRRIHQILVPEYFFRWFDDYTLGIVMLVAAYMAWRDKPNSIHFLIAAWGIAAGGLGLSFLGQLDALVHGIPDAGVFSSALVTIVKALILLYTIMGIRYSIKGVNPQTP